MRNLLSPFFFLLFNVMPYTMCIYIQTLVSSPSWFFLPFLANKKKKQIPTFYTFYNEFGKLRLRKKKTYEI